MVYNVREYHTPTDLDEARRLLNRRDVRTVILAGGTTVMGEGGQFVEALVDLSKLGLDQIETGEDVIHIGSMVTLQTIVEDLADVDGGLLAEAARRVAGWNLRNTATIGGMLVGGDIHSPLSVCMAALRARVKVYEQAGESPYWLEMTKEARLKTLAGQIITSFSVIRPGEPIGTAYAQVGRTPADRPIVCAAASALRQAGAWETVTVIGGLFHDLHAIELRVDAGDPDSGLSQLAAAVTEQAPSATYQSDYLGSAEYRRAIAPTLARRALETAIRNAG